jgi:hypothetical protein
MDEQKIPLPAWFAWAMVACLAALVAGLGELWLVERARSQLLRDENLLAGAALKAAQNQLEAERILGRRQAEQAPAGLAGFGAALLSAPEGSPAGAGPAPPWGVVIWDGARRNGLLRVSRLPEAAADRDYQLWLEGPGAPYPSDCGVFHGPRGGGDRGVPFNVNAPVGSGCRFILLEVKKGGALTLPEAQAGGSIVLASGPLSGRISDP